MPRKVKVLILILAVAAIMMLSMALKIMSEKVPENGISTTGNTAGNSNNGGLFAESNGKVYFSNSFDKGYVYSMNPDETEIKKVNGTPASHILVGGDYLYYYMDTSDGGEGLGYVIKTFGIYRSKLDGSKSKCLDRNLVVNMNLAGDYIYYQRYTNKDFTQIYRIKTDKTEMAKVTDEIINPSCIADGIIYFNGTEKDHHLYAMDTTNNTVKLIYKGNVWFPQYNNGYIYYLDLDNDMKICRLKLGANTVEILTQDRVEAFNVGDSYIYYQTIDAENPCLKRVHPDGSGNEVVAYGYYNSINLTSQYAYFKEYLDDVTIYHTPVNGPINVEPFAAAILPDK